jgi:cation transport protein ChaC
MDPREDPFLHHPDLRGQIADPLGSFFRTFTTADLARMAREHGLVMDWWYGDAEREATRLRELAGRGDGDLWLFGYGSLMWDPAIRFAEVRRAHVVELARRFILKDIHGGRGTADRPGLMAALDTGPRCDGLAYRIPAELVEEETKVLWQRERIGPAYTAAFVEVVAGDDAVTALAFVADHAAPPIDASLTRGDQVRFLATGAGILGTSLDYIRQIERKFDALGVHDDDVAGLRRDAEAYARSMGSG